MNEKITDKWINDTGLVFALFFLIMGYMEGSSTPLYISGGFLLSLIIFPRILYPVAFLWKKLGDVLGLIVPKIFFGIVFFFIILPIGALRRVFKGDCLFISNWKESKSVFFERNHLFTKKDLEDPY